MSFIISKTGKRIGCEHGMTHDVIIEQRFNCSILQFMKRGGVRVKIHQESMAIEYRGTISDKQNQIINAALREQDIFCVISDSGLEYNRIEKFRPIRNFVFEGTLIPK